MGAFDCPFCGAPFGEGVAQATHIAKDHCQEDQGVAYYAFRSFHCPCKIAWSFGHVRSGYQRFALHLLENGGAAAHFLGVALGGSND